MEKSPEITLSIELPKDQARKSYKSLYLNELKEYNILKMEMDRRDRELIDLKNKYEILLLDYDDRINKHSQKCRENQRANPESLRRAQMRYYYKKKIQEGKTTRKDPFLLGVFSKEENLN
jgi:hypothetical protein